jgi:hypothetical protein
MTVFQELEQLKVANAQLTDQLATAQVENETLKASAAKAEKEKADAIAPVQAQADASIAENAQLKEQLKSAQSASDDKVALKAAEIAQTQGNVPPISFKVNENPANKSGSFIEQLNEISDPLERAKFIRANRDRIQKEQSSQSKK